MIDPRFEPEVLALLLTVACSSGGDLEPRAVDTRHSGDPAPSESTSADDALTSSDAEIDAGPSTHSGASTAVDAGTMSAAEAAAERFSTELTHDEHGTVHAADNDVGVDGPWVPYLQGFDVGTLSVEEHRVCMVGVAGPFVENRYPWALRLTLLLTSGDGANAVWDGSPYSGFSFTLQASFSGDAPVMKAGLFAFSEPESLESTQYAVPVEPGEHTLSWSDFSPEEGASVEPLNPSLLTHFMLRVEGLEEGSEYELCVANVAVF